MKYLVWDIDGTLIKTGRAGLHALKQTMLDLYSIETEFDFPAGGRTDRFISYELLKKVAHIPLAEQEQHSHKILKYYEEILPAFLQQYQGEIMPNVTAILDFIAPQQTAYTSTLLTGNTLKGAIAKMHRYGLKHYFDFSLGVFGDNSICRNELSQQFLQNLQNLQPQINPKDIIIIGDTLHDIECAQHIGAKCIAVATGSVNLETLSQANPWRAYAELPTPLEFVKLFQA